MDCNTFESTYGRRYPLEHDGYTYPRQQQQWQHYYEQWSSFDQGNSSLDFNYDQPYSSTYYDEPSHIFHEEQVGNYISEPCYPHFLWDFELKDLLHKLLGKFDDTFKAHQGNFLWDYELKDMMYTLLEKSDEIFESQQERLINDELLLEIRADFEELKRQFSKLMRQEARLKRQQHAKLMQQLQASPIEILVESNEETDISQSIPCESEEESQQEEELCELESEIESIAEVIKEEKDEVVIEKFEESPIEKPVETRVEVEDKTEIGYSNFELEEFVIPPYVPSQYLELKILLGQVKGDEGWLIQLKIYFLDATKGKERILSSTPKFFMFSMKNCKGMKFLMHGWHNFPFDPGGVELWSG